MAVILFLLLIIESDPTENPLLSYCCSQISVAAAVMKVQQHPARAAGASLVVIVNERPSHLCSPLIAASPRSGRVDQTNANSLGKSIEEEGKRKGKKKKNKGDS